MVAIARFTVVLVAALALWIGPVLARPDVDWRVHVGEAAARFGLPEAWVLRVIAAESGGRTHLDGKPITSHAGAMGLMQIMPATWASLRAEFRLGSDPHHPRDNIVAGTAYLRKMYDRFGYPGLFAAYNAGPGRYREYLAHGRPLPRETRDYVAKITSAAPPPRLAYIRVRDARTSANRRAHGSDREVQLVEEIAVDPIFLQRISPAIPALKAGTTVVEVPPRDRPEGGVQGSAAAAKSIFLLRKPAAIDGR